MPIARNNVKILLDQIEARVRPTVCDTYSSRGMTREGRISEDDLDTLKDIADALMTELQ